MKYPKPIGEFTLGGAKWLVELIQDDSSRFTYDTHRNIISINEASDKGENYNFQVLEKHFYEALLCLIVRHVMYYDKHFPQTTSQPYSSLLYQALSTLILQEWEGSFQLGGVEWFITIDSETCHKENFCGCTYPQLKKIILSDINPSKELVHEDFIWQTLYHEILHAVAIELGQGDTKINSERFVNVLAYFLYEVRKSLTLNFQIL